jgi:acyl-coenzyme A synthetase/AMP-(fatty) acid ligase
VADGVFFVREDDEGPSASATSRLAAVAVAPGLTAEDLLRLLRERIDPVFLPRPLLLVDRIPRNATGKLPRAVLESLVARR